jgi:membrane-bound lytic murein transglycosylase B
LKPAVNSPIGPVPARRRVAPLLAASILALLLNAFAAPGAAAARAVSKKPPAAAAGGGGYASRSDVREFIDGLVDRHGFDRGALEKVFREVRRQPTVLRLIAPAPAGFKRSWETYRARFLDPLRIEGGIAFWRENEAALERASSVYGVPPEVIVAIIGVETIYGRVTGEFRVIDALATLAFDYPRRAEFFREELEQFLLMTRENGADVFAVRGSFAGAIGLPQFMPGSIRRYAIDFDSDGRIDLRSNPVDAIGSVARFLSEHGWVPGAPVYFPTRIEDRSRLGPLIEAGIEPQFRSEQLAEFGVSALGAAPDDPPLALIDLPNGDSPTTYLLGARNFYVITRYNRSSFYAMAVTELADALRSSRP